MKNVKAKIKVLGYQKKFIDNEAQYSLFLGGFGSGKTEAGILRTLKFIKKFGKIFKEKKLGLYVFGIYEPTYDLIRTILFGRFEEIMNKYNIEYKLNKSDKTLLIPSFNALIIFRSLENVDKIIGYEHADFWIDELDTLAEDKAKEAWKKVIGRNRLSKYKIDISKEKENREKMLDEDIDINDFINEKFDINIHNSGFVTTTPEGYRFCYNTFENIKEELKTKYATFRGNTLENIFIDKNYVLDLLQQYPKNIQDAYLRGYYVNMQGSNVYYNFKRDKCNININVAKYFSIYKDAQKQLHIGMDFNIEKMAAVVAVHNNLDNELYILDEFKNIFDTAEMIKVIKEKYGEYEIFIYPDSAGNQRKTSAGSKTDITLLKEAGFKVIVDKNNPAIKDRVMSVNSLFENGLGIKKLFINVNNCTELTENLEKQIYDKNTGQPDKKSGNDHIIDALGYLVYKLYPVKRQLFLHKKR